jgi:hypothetical protein
VTAQSLVSMSAHVTTQSLLSNAAAYSMTTGVRLVSNAAAKC